MTGTKPAEILPVITPARFEGFFEEGSRLSAEDRGNIAKVTAVGAKCSLDFLPPPPPPAAASK